MILQSTILTSIILAHLTPPHSEIRNPSAKPRATCLNQPNRHPAPTNPKSEIRNPKLKKKWLGGIPNSELRIPNSTRVADRKLRIENQELWRLI